MSTPASPGFDPGFSTPEMATVFSAAARIDAMLRVEAALARAGAACGVLPAHLAEEITTACGTPVDDPVGLLTTGWERGTAVVALLDELRPRLTPAAAEALHLGATTQDIVDTAMMLQLKEALALLGAPMRRVAHDLVRLAADHRNTPALGRTFLQQAVPTTFGLRVAQWLDPLLDVMVDLELSSTRLPVQLGGPVGNPATYGDTALAVTERLAAELDLVVPTLPWHTDRSRIAELVAVVQRGTRVVAKIGTDLALLAASEIGEVRMRSGGSSSMPSKRNPIDAVRAVAAADACGATASLVTGAAPHELDRAVGSWHVETFAVPVVFQTAAAAVDAIATAVATLEVDAARMLEHVGEEPDPAVAEVAATLIGRVLAKASVVVGEAPA